MTILRHAMVFASLLVLWVILAVAGGHLYLGLGIICAAAVTLLVGYLRLVDPETVPFRLGLHLLAFWAWLAGAIMKSAVDVAIRILKGPSAISPRTVTIPSSHQSDLLRVIFANSITLTPGTVTMSVSGEELVVHGLTEDSAGDVEHGEMHKRVLRLERSEK